MNILILGAGGREHCFAWKLKQSALCSKLFIAPGNAGTAACGTNLPIAVDDFEGIKAAVLREKVKMLVVGPEDPLVKGIADFFAADAQLNDILVIGPAAAAAQLEGSKAFAKSFMQRHGIPTAAYAEFTADTYEEGIAYLRNHSLPVVLKADGLAAGKGVLICQSLLEALAEFDLMLNQEKFGAASHKVVVEAFLEGIETSVFALTDGLDYLILPEAKDYKRIGEGDKGLNTGGMGAVSPVPFFDDDLRERIRATVIEPTIAGLQKDNLDYCGFLFFGLMIDNGNPYVIEYNCRMGDPETEVVVPRIESDLVELFIAAANKKLAGATIDIAEYTAATTVAVSGGYPGEFQKGLVITGFAERLPEDCLLFHAGTRQANGEVLTNGGRVLAMTAFGSNVAEAVFLSQRALKKIKFDGMYFRRDIGYEF